MMKPSCLRSRLCSCRKREGSQVLKWRIPIAIVRVVGKFSEIVRTKCNQVRYQGGGCEWRVRGESVLIWLVRHTYPRSSSTGGYGRPTTGENLRPGTSTLIGPEIKADLDR